MQVQEAAAQLVRSQQLYEELQRKQEALLRELQSRIARRSAIQIKVRGGLQHVGGCRPGPAWLALGIMLVIMCAWGGRDGWHRVSCQASGKHT